MSLPCGSAVKNLPVNAGEARDTGDGFDQVRKIPWRRKWQPTPVFLPGKSPKQKSLVGYSPQGVTKESDMTEHTHTTFMIEPLKLGIEGHFLKMIKGIYKTLTTNTINDKGLNAFHLQSRIRQGCVLQPLRFNSILKVLDSAKRQDKEILKISRLQRKK